MEQLPGFLQVDPGLIIWSIVNFVIFAFIIAKFGWKPMREGLAAREQAIADAVAGAERANAESQALLRESKERLAGAQSEMMNIIKDGKVQAEAAVRKAADEAEQVKQQKLAETQREIERQKDDAIKQLRSEVTTLVIDATEKLVGRKLDSEDHRRLIESSVNDLSKN
jgi:F-type H+-transporting ATPase subunit b